MTPMQIARVLRKAVGEDSREQRVIARLARLHPVSLSQFKLGRRSLPLPALDRLARALGYEIAIIKRRRR